jgi:AcrR family transcriptional regulator
MCEQDRLEVVLRDAGRSGRAQHLRLLGARHAQRHLHPLVERAERRGQGHREGHLVGAGPHRGLQAPRPQQFHGADARQGRARQRHRRGPPLREDDPDTGPGKGDRRGEPGGAGPDDHDVGVTATSRLHHRFLFHRTACLMTPTVPRFGHAVQSIWKNARMVTRRYEQRARLDSAEATRRRILAAVHQHLRETPTQPVSIDAVARHAGVARSTVYVVFGSRSGLFDALVDDLWERSGLPGLTAAVAHPDAREHLRGGIHAANRMYAAERDVYRILFSMAQLEPDSLGAAIARKEDSRLGGMRYLVSRLAEQGLLRAGVTRRQALDVLWTLCSFETFDLLHHGRGRSVAATSALTARMAEDALLVPAGTG